MTPDKAENIFYELGDVLEKQLLLEPEKHGPSLRCVSRTGLRKAILMWVAKKKFEGTDILFRHELLPGKRVAVLELAQNIWPFVQVFGQVENGLPVFESKSETSLAAQKHGDFVDFLLKLSPSDLAYWEKVQAKLT